MAGIKNCLLGAAAIGVACSAVNAGGIGADVIVGDLPNVSNYTAIDGTKAYAVGTTSCNIGDDLLLWIASNNQHPVIAQNLYRYHNGVLMQVGQSWLKHGFTALRGNLCDTCDGNGGSVLGIGCSDPYSSGLNGSQFRLGPRFEVNAFTGAYNYPFSEPDGSSGNSVFKRLQVRLDQVLPSMMPGARFFVEGHYITADDAVAGNGHNNASYREVSMSASGNLSIISSRQTQREKPGIMAWADIDPDAHVFAADVPSEGRFYVGYKVTDNGDGTWTYNYAVHNLNSDRSARLFSVEIPTGVNVTDVGFNDVFYHSGEPFDGTDWASSLEGGTFMWFTSMHGSNPDANAIRWGTMYNFWFTADSAPEAGRGQIGLFKPGAIGSANAVGINVSVPSAGALCLGDCDNSGSVDFNDLVSMLFEFGSGAGTTCDADESGSVDFNDLVTALFSFGPCP